MYSIGNVVIDASTTIILTNWPTCWKLRCCFWDLDGQFNCHWLRVLRLRTGYWPI